MSQVITGNDARLRYKPFQPILTSAGLQRFDLTMKAQAASQALSSAVHSYLQIDTSKPLDYALIPDGTQAVFMSPQGTIIGGAQSFATDIEILAPGKYFGVRFYPGALQQFFDLNLSEITNQYVDSQYFQCCSFNALHERLYAADEFLSRVNIFEQWLMVHFKPRSNSTFDLALSLIYHSFGNIQMSEVAGRVGWSLRHLNRVFKKHTGLSTKSFSQTIRIQRACQQLCAGYGDSLQAETALNLGFFDQAHFLNAFKKQLMMNPRVFLERFKSEIDG